MAYNIYISAKGNDPQSIYNAVATYRHFSDSIEDAKKYQIGNGYNTILELHCDEEGNIQSQEDIKVVYTTDKEEWRFNKI